MASFATLLVILSVSCAAEVKGVSKRADTKDDVCNENSKGLSFLQTEGLLNLHQKSLVDLSMCGKRALVTNTVVIPT